MTFGEDTQRTPRSKPGPGNASLDHRPIPMPGMNNVPSLPPSQSSNASHAATSVPPSEASPSRPEGSPTRGKRQKSPVKNANSLRAMELPVISAALGNDPVNTLPPDAHGLFQSIQDIADDHECFHELLVVYEPILFYTLLTISTMFHNLPTHSTSPTSELIHSKCRGIVKSLCERVCVVR
ncbi:hypothetical protein EDB80DRAFT_841970 [Ilyonectria destructans]|nr:hypothetical protein EDB80DRAFT_841970 [Ilyonectria destructans]